MKQYLITYDERSKTFDVFSGATGKGKPLLCVVLKKKEDILIVLEKIIQESIDQGYKVNLTNELEVLRTEKIHNIIKSKELLLSSPIEEIKPKFRNYRLNKTEVH